MKKFAILLVPLMIFALMQVSWSEVVEVSEAVEGSVSIDMTGVDTTAVYAQGMTRYAITVPSRNESWDGVMFYFYFPDFTDPGDSCGEGAIDSAFARVKTGTGYLERTIYDDTCEALPCTLSGSFSMEQYMDLLKGGALDVLVQDSSSDSVWAGQAFAPDIDTLWDALRLDHMWFEYYCVDSAGTEGHLNNTFNYWFRFWKER